MNPAILSVLLAIAVSAAAQTQQAQADAPTVSFHGTSLPSYVFTGRGADVSAQIVAALDAAQRTIQAALYTLTLPNVTEALLRAKARGVQVEVLYDYGHSTGNQAAGSSQPGVSDAPSQLGRLLSAGVDVRALRGSGPYGIMHNKFLVADGELLETGSFNWTTAAENQNHENALFRQDPALSAEYQSYFSWMWAQAKPIGAGPAEPSGTPPACVDGPVALGRSWPRCSFSPSGPTESLLADAISRARSRVHIAMFSFTSPAVVSAIIDAKRRGVDVELVFDRLQARSEESLRQLRAAGVAYKLDAGQGGSAGVLHDKFGLFDDLLETGSFNYTTNASNNNFENAYFSSSPEDAAGYEAEFQAIYAEGS